MARDMRKQLLLPLTLCLVSIVMSFLIVAVYMLTKDNIEAQAAAAREAARRSVLSRAVTMTEQPLDPEAPVDYCFEGFDAAGQSIGFVSQITVMGFGGPIEVTVGMDSAGCITGVNVGGSDFSETSGLGAKTRDEEFTGQFTGKSGMLILKKDIDSVTGASVSSGAVVSGVNQALVYMTERLPEPAELIPVEEIPLSEEEQAVLLPGGENLRFMGGGPGIDGWWQADNGRIVQATGFGLGPIVVRVGMNNDGYCVGIIIGDEDFMESEGYGARLQEPAFWQSFLGKKGEQSFGAGGVDAISGASTSSKAALSAINACLSFVPGEGTAASGEGTEPRPEEIGGLAVVAWPAEQYPSGETETASLEVSQEPEAGLTADAVTEASAVSASPTPGPVSTPSPVPTADAVTEASAVSASPTPGPVPTPSPVPTADAVTEASTVQSTPVPSPTPVPDARSGATLGG